MKQKKITNKKTNIGELHLKTILKVENSSKMVRSILVFLVFACIIIFIGLWNSLNFSWLQSRIKMHEYQLYWYKHIVGETLPSNLSRKEIKFFYACKDYYKSKHYTKEILISELENLKKAELNYSIFIKVPFINVNFDVNDLGLIGGFGLTIIYFLLLYSLINRYNQLENVFYLIKKIEKKSEKESAFLLVVMDQILTLPRQGIKHYKLIRLAPRILYIIPILVLLTILINDIYTFKNGSYYLYSLGKTISVYIASFLFLTLSVIQSIFCIHIVIQTDKLWKRNYPKKLFPNIND